MRFFLIKNRDLFGGQTSQKVASKQKERRRNMATQRREHQHQERGEGGGEDVDLENHHPHQSVLLSSSTTPSPPKKERQSHHPFSSASNETNDDGKEQTFTSLKVLCYLLIFIASFVFYEDLLVARVAVRKHFFGLESGVGASQLLGEEEPESDLIDTRTGKLDLNLRHISKRKRERVETIEEHNNNVQTARDEGILP